MSRDEDPLMSPDAEDPLDQMLDAARWPEPRPDRLKRLQEHWRRLSPARPPRQRPGWTAAGVAIAAGLLIGVVLWQWGVRRSPPRPPRAPRITAQPSRRLHPANSLTAVPGKREMPSRPAVSDESPPRSPSGPADGDARVLARSRPATPYERLAFRVLAGRRQPSDDQRRRRLLERAIARYVADPTSNLDELAEPLLAWRGDCEQLLADRIGRSRGPQKIAAIELLGCVGSRRSVPLLLALRGDAAVHSAALRSLVRLADSETIGQAASAETDPCLQQHLLAALLARHDARSVAVYLRLVCERPTAEAALAALGGEDHPPVDLLFRFLRSPTRTQRTAAALALASLNDQGVTEKLVQMVVREGNRQEALVALLASSDPRAVRFVTLARRDPLLVGSVRTVEYRLKTLFP